MRILGNSGRVVAAVAVYWLFAGSALAESVWLPAVVEIPAGKFIFGSNRAEREAAYRLDESAYGHSVTRKQRWYENEYKRQTRSTGRYFITWTPVTNAQYGAFITETGHPVPDVDRESWKGSRLIHPWARSRRHAWVTGKVPKGRADHPVVMVSYKDAQQYAAWLSRKTGETWRLPSEEEWEKAARGSDGRRFPWGDEFDPKRLNSHDAGPFDGRYAQGQSLYGLLDAAGQVF